MNWLCSLSFSHSATQSFCIKIKGEEGGEIQKFRRQSDLCLKTKNAERANLAVIVWHQKLYLQKEDIFKMIYFFLPVLNTFKNASGNGFQKQLSDRICMENLAEILLKVQKDKHSAKQMETEGHREDVSFPLNYL